LCEILGTKKTSADKAPQINQTVFFTWTSVLQSKMCDVKVLQVLAQNQAVSKLYECVLHKLWIMF
jgi:hypothetical protein